jgi:multimeric flavodoxin WrbA
VDPDSERHRLKDLASGWLDQIEAGTTLEAPPLPETEPRDLGRRPGRALLLVGSPRGKKSTSMALGGYLHQRLEEAGLETEVVRLYTTLKSQDRREEVVEAVARADLVTLAAPVYVDSLPAPVLATLERIASRRSELDASGPRHFVALTNCGFPEAVHTQTALAVCRSFAHQAGFVWGGGLGLGGGAGLVDGRALPELGKRAEPIRKSLDAAALALAQGRALPAEAFQHMARAGVPSWLYRIVASLVWRRQARRWGARKELDARPYA